MFKWPWISRKRHEEEIREMARQVHEYTQQVNSEIQKLLWDHGQFRIIHALREAEVNHLKSLVNEMQENQR